MPDHGVFPSQDSKCRVQNDEQTRQGPALTSLPAPAPIQNSLEKEAPLVIPRVHPDSKRTQSGWKPVDYISLAALRQVIRPKFSWDAGQAAGSLPGGGASCNLFGQLVRNGAGVESVGHAARNRVILPPYSVFLMSDIKQMSPLVAGKSCRGSGVEQFVDKQLPSCLCPPISLPQCFHIFLT